MNNIIDHVLEVSFEIFRAEFFFMSEFLLKRLNGLFINGMAIIDR